MNLHNLQLPQSSDPVVDKIENVKALRIVYTKMCQLNNPFSEIAQWQNIQLHAVGDFYSRTTSTDSGHASYHEHHYLSNASKMLIL